jgi:hypothetical protein
MAAAIFLGRKAWLAARPPWQWPAAIVAFLASAMLLIAIIPD